jgi:hypothetical protein
MLNQTLFRGRNWLTAWAQWLSDFASDDEETQPWSDGVLKCRTRSVMDAPKVDRCLATRRRNT